MTGTGHDRAPWREELRETLRLAWPLILTNFTQALIPATDVVLLGWAGKDKLAAASLGVNLVNGCMIFGVGVVMASAPMIARARFSLRAAVMAMAAASATHRAAMTMIAAAALAPTIKPPSPVPTSFGAASSRLHRKPMDGHKQVRQGAVT